MTIMQAIKVGISTAEADPIEKKISVKTIEGEEITETYRSTSQAKYVWRAVLEEMYAT